MRDSDDTYEDDEVEETSSDGVTGSLFDLGYIKLVFLVFLLFLFINSGVFVDKVLSNISGTIDHDSPTSKGIFIQACMYTVSFVAIDFLVGS